MTTIPRYNMSVSFYNGFYFLRHTPSYARPEAVTKHVTYVPCLKRLKGITWTVASRKNVNVFSIYRYLEVFLSEYYRKRLRKAKEPEFWPDTVRNWIVRNDPFNGQNDSNSYFEIFSCYWNILSGLSSINCIFFTWVLAL